MGVVEVMLHRFIKMAAKMAAGKMATAAPPLHEDGCQDGDRSSTASAPKMALLT
jgi:hypothetical protein